MKTCFQEVNIETKKTYDFIDVTEKALEFVKSSKIKNGLLNLQTLHTTATFIFNENEPLLILDFVKNLERLFPQSAKYEHDNLEKRTVNVCQDECANGHAHCKAILLSSTLTLNLINGKLQLGQWQRIFFVELDKPRKRKFQLHIIGE